MASGTNNSQYFTNGYFLYKTATTGVYTIGYSAGHGVTVTDTPDSPADDTTQLGDIQNDIFKTAKGTSTPATRTYFGEAVNAGGVVGTYTGKRGLTYALYTNNTYTRGNTTTLDTKSFALMCFASGTAIRTDRGDVAVEEIVVGDRAVTASGATRPVSWIGCRHVGGEGLPLPFALRPVRIRADAFGSGMPYRDLMLSPGHPVLVGADEDSNGGHLVPVMCLINGTTIDRIAAEEMTYWHIELDEHDILLAEGLPAESYLDLGSRAFFDGADVSLHDPDALVAGDLLAARGRCRPVAVAGPSVDAARADLDRHFAFGLSSQCMWPSDLHDAASDKAFELRESA